MQQFLGSHKTQNYVIKKSYIEGNGTHIRLYHTRLTPQNPHATICIIHGFGEHSGRFLHIAEFFAINRYQVLLVDLRGFGYSGGARGCSQLDQLQKDVIAVLRQANPDLPLFLYGHSLGGLVLSTLLIDYPKLNVSGTVLTSPFYGMSKHAKIPAYKLWLVKQIGHKLEDFVINAMINPTALTKVNKHIQSIFADRLIIPFLSVKMGRSMILESERIMENARYFKVPVIIFHGKSDSITNYEDSQAFIRTAGSTIKNLHLFPNGYHELQHDEECDQMLKIAAKWLETLPSRSKLGELNTTYSKVKTIKKFDRRWLIVIILYIVSLMKLSRNSKYNQSILRILLSPLLFILRI